MFVGPVTPQDVVIAAHTLKHSDWQMCEALGLLHAAVDVTRRADRSGLSPNVLGDTLLRVQREVEALQTVVATLAFDVEQSGLAGADGSRDAADWFAKKGKVTPNKAKNAIKLGGALDRSQDLQDALD
ncbi:MAG TPA: hypothetical protein PLV68_18365, partial [Ilumatobacteraceae bacterium]|nr:hypothetical protein [Ilumatobacteraceae bacterium]